MTDRSDDKQLPPWLRGVPLPPRPVEPAAALWASAPALPPAPAAEEERIPDWLSEIATPPSTPINAPVAPLSSPSADQQELPSWLTDLSGSVDAASGPAADADEDIPDWLRSSEPTPAPPAPSAPAGRSSVSSGFTGWLSTNPDSSTPPTPPTPPTPIKETRSAEPLPAWLSSSEASSGSDESSASDLPDWLQSLDPAADLHSSNETISAPPSWMNDRAQAPAQPPQPTPPPEASTPSWLDSSTDEPSVPPPAAQPEDDAGELPGWLQSISDDDIRRVTEGDDDDLGVAPFTFGSADESKPATSSQPPSWLAALPDVDEGRPSGEASEWLGANASQLIPAQPAPLAPDVPDWLRDATSDDSDEEAPAWLRGPESPTSSASELTMSPGAAADVPAWLRGTAEEAQPAQDDDVPAWLRESGQTIGSQTAPVAPSDSFDFGAPPAAAEQPDWLSAAEPAAPDLTPPAAPSADDLPDWLKSDAPIHAPDLALPPAPAADDLPAWLRDTAAPVADSSASTLPPWLRDETGQPMPSAMAPGDINLPAWLRGADTTPATPVPPVAASPDPAPPTATPSSLDWFEDTGKQASTTTSSELLGGADLPAWLRSETERPRENNPADARSLDWLARLGAYDDDTPIAATADATPRLMLPAAPTRTPAQLEALTLLRRMASSAAPQAEVAEQAAPTTPLGRIGIEQVFSLLLLVLLIVGLAVPGLATSLAGVPSAPPPEAGALLEQIKPLGENDIVLIGYEWDAQRISELRPLERAVIEQLIDQRVKLVLVSTDPQSTMLQFDLRDRLNAANYQGGGLDYVLLGYRPGGEIGLRQLAQNLRGALQRDFQGRDATIGALATNLSTSEPRLSTLDDFAMAVVFADEPTDVQSWMEQIRPAMKKPIAFLVPAGVQPISQPYFRQPGIFSLAGMQGALAYEQLRGGDNTSQTALQASQLRLATLLFAGLLLLGLVAVLVSTAVNRRRSHS